jgi:hypothetical protein
MSADIPAGCVAEGTRRNESEPEGTGRNRKNVTDPRIQRLLFVLLAAVSCRETTAPVSESIGLVVSKGAGTRLVLAEQAPTAWDTFCVFGPYTTDDVIRKTSGVDAAADQAHDIARRDDIDLLLFIEKSRVVSAVPHPRSRGDFGPEVVGTCYARNDAVFAIRTPPAGSWGTIGRAN